MSSSLKKISLSTSVHLEETRDKIVAVQKRIRVQAREHVTDI